MAISNSQRVLIRYIEESGVIDDRFTEIKCINVSADDKKRGALSLVFKAKDTIEDEIVIIKIMDPNFLSDDYRLKAFEREPRVLTKILNRSRCLKLIFGPNEFTWNIVTEDKITIPLKLSYFVTNFVCDDIDEYFVGHDKISPLEKLKVFRSTVLAVKAVHSQDVSHRDLKWDNFRANHSPQPHYLL